MHLLNMSRKIKRKVGVGAVSKLSMDVIVDLQYGDCGKGKVAHFFVQE